MRSYVDFLLGGYKTDSKIGVISVHINITPDKQRDCHGALPPQAHTPPPLSPMSLGRRITSLTFPATSPSHGAEVLDYHAVASGWK
jgi:hypothetical protein